MTDRSSVTANDIYSKALELQQTPHLGPDFAYLYLQTQDDTWGNTEHKTTFDDALLRIATDEIFARQSICGVSGFHWVDSEPNDGGTIVSMARRPSGTEVEPFTDETVARQKAAAVFLGICEKCPFFNASLCDPLPAAKKVEGGFLPAVQSSI